MATRKSLTRKSLALDPSVALDAATKQYIDNLLTTRGVPAGGVAGQVLAKASGTDYDDAWVHPAGLAIFQGRGAAGNTLPAANTWYALRFDAEDADSHNAHDTAVATNYRWFPQLDGFYQISGQVLFSSGHSTSSPSRGARLAKNGTQVKNTQILGTYTGQLLTLVVPPVLVYCVVGDYIELQVMSALAGQGIFGNATDGPLLTAVLVRAG